MDDNATAFLLGTLLKSVSRSFYLTLQVLPRGMRDPIGLAYLLARAADTIADTSLIMPSKRLELLLSLRSQVNGVADSATLAAISSQIAGHQKDSSERILLESLGSALDLLSELGDADQQAVRGIVATLTEGMEYDLRIFPDEAAGRIVALPEFADLDRYTYMVAGCVGRFWTEMTCLHLPGALRADPAATMDRGIRLGKALQMTNVLRDCGKDLRIGRCYLPFTMLDRAGLSVEDLSLPSASLRARPILLELVEVTLAHYRAGILYALSLPASSIRLRLACMWPIIIGLETVLKLVENDHWLDPAKASKIQRHDVYRILGFSLPSAASNSLLRLWTSNLIGRIEAASGRN